MDRWCKRCVNVWYLCSLFSCLYHPLLPSLPSPSFGQFETHLRCLATSLSKLEQLHQAFGRLIVGSAKTGFILVGKSQIGDLLSPFDSLTSGPRLSLCEKFEEALLSLMSRNDSSATRSSCEMALSTVSAPTHFVVASPIENRV